MIETPSVWPSKDPTKGFAKTLSNFVAFRALWYSRTTSNGFTWLFTFRLIGCNSVFVFLSFSFFRNKDCHFQPIFSISNQLKWSTVLVNLAQIGRYIGYFVIQYDSFGMSHRYESNPSKNQIEFGNERKLSWRMKWAGFLLNNFISSDIINYYYYFNKQLNIYFSLD